MEVFSASRFAGPLPHPEILSGYEQACPGAALRIIQMAEEEGHHRRLLEARAVDAQIDGMRRQFAEARLGQVFAFLVAALFLGGGTYVASHGQPWAGATFGGIGVGGIVTTFILGRAEVSKRASEEDDAAPAAKPSPPPPAKRRR